MMTEMTQVHLVGGGVDTLGDPALLRPFVESALARAAGHASRPRLALVLADDRGLAAKFRPPYIEPFEALLPGGFDFMDVFVGGATPADPAVLGSADGFVVGGGPTPVYLAALAPVAPVLRSAVAAGVPYLGFSAGAMVAASPALAGGWCHGGLAVCEEDWSEGLVEIEVREGLDLVPFCVDVHATQGGLLSRAASLPGLPGVERAMGIDEGTCLSVCAEPTGELRLRVSGRGFVWDVARGGDDTMLLRRLASL
ncbi:Type 1 glutamine amidotransferase-like domain-containing protein [Nocardioides mesophilus]|uniref:Type 1 glutamine amidotransferase-like domain-containing protein n=1 Tax=Nocardioides mesophilus TaxID=433659 RepID=A0A7G9R6C5_9ACTN|nr:Type 1 glutamine amidotransferase-like domain-containing protein [Nocardioides mesophilus]QNN51150.1 Type 1 glutamine amidotransferase-like domain-containing protein [Nocardioides mesophilus]